MKSSSALRSALGPAAIRAVESYRQKRLFNDPLALKFLPPIWRGIIELMRLPVIGPGLLALRERQYPGAIGNLLCRTRYIDDVLQDELNRRLDQVVILGAGFDSRAYRIPGVDKVHVFEVDHPGTQDVKKSRLERIFGTQPSHVTFVPIDFDRQKLDETMKDAGFRSDVKTCFIWEGVTQYITPEAVDSTFWYISNNASPGSTIVFTYIRRGIIDGSARTAADQKFVSIALRLGVPWIFGFDPAGIEQYLSEREIMLIEQVGAPEYRTRYLEPLNRPMNIFEGEQVVLARIKGEIEGN